MTKRLVDLDDADVAAAREALGTKTLKDTVTKALKEAGASAARAGRWSGWSAAR